MILTCFSKCNHLNSLSNLFTFALITVLWTNRIFFYSLHYIYLDWWWTQYHSPDNLLCCVHLHVIWWHSVTVGLFSRSAVSLQVSAGWKHGDSLDEQVKSHPLLKPYKALSEKVNSVSNGVLAAAVAMIECTAVAQVNTHSGWHHILH